MAFDWTYPRARDAEPVIGRPVGGTRLLTLTETAQRLGVSRWTVRAYIDRGVMPFAIEVGRNRYRVPAAALEWWLAAAEEREMPLTLGTTGRVGRRAR